MSEINSVHLIGRFTRDPEVRYTKSQTAVARFSIAIDRGKDKNGNELGTDFPNIVCFGRTAEVVEKYCSKGRQVGIQGRIQTGSYEKDGKKYYTTKVLADRIELLGSKDSSNAGSNSGSIDGNPFDDVTPGPDDVPAGFSKLDPDDIPF